MKEPEDPEVTWRRERAYGIVGLVACVVLFITGLIQLAHGDGNGLGILAVSPVLAAFIADRLNRAYRRYRGG